MKTKILYALISIISCYGILHYPFRTKMAGITKAYLTNKINGFYGLIGPDIDFKNVDSLYDLFTGDGIIQGVFIDGGNITYAKHKIRTEKLVYEEQNGRQPTNVMSTLLFMLMNKLNIMPNMLGLANTALLNVKTDVYALFERDLPYAIDVDFEKKTLKTRNRVLLSDVNHISGHSKYNKNTETITTIDYDVLKKHITFYNMQSNFSIINQTTIKTNYLPVVHDYLVLKDDILIVDSPFGLNYNKILQKMPVMLDKTKETIVHIINKHDFSVARYHYPTGFYVFHYGNYEEFADRYEIYASIYESIDFSSLNIEGKYRKLVIYKQSKRIEMIQNPALETFNLDFPIAYKNLVVLRNVHKNVINGFVICDKLTIKKELLFKEVEFCGEPAITEIDQCPYVLSFANENEKGLLVIINLNTYKVIKITLQENIKLGFHSLFIPRPCQ